MVDAPEPGDWPRAGDWLAGGRGRPGGLVVAGVPVVEGAVTPSRYDLAPGAIRARLAKLSTFHGERRVDLATVPVADLGDSLTPPPLLGDSPGIGPGLTVLLGGHNALTWLALEKATDLRDWGLLTLDAHHDVRPYRPGAVGNGSPVRALIDAGLPGSQVVQIGIHGFSNSSVHRAWCDARGVTVLPPDAIVSTPEWLRHLARRCAYLYVDIDIDVLDRAFAPGAPGSRPGGVLPRALLEAAFTAGAHPQVRAIDIVEVDPEADVANITTDVAALCLLNAAAGFATRR